MQEKTVFECHKSRKCSSIVCVNCGKVYHKSCAERNFKGKVKFLDETRLTCCETDLTSITDSVLREEICLLRQLVKEITEKNLLLEENKKILNEKIQFLEEEKQKKKKKRHENSSGKQVELASPQRKKRFDHTEVIVEVLNPENPISQLPSAIEQMQNEDSGLPLKQPEAFRKQQDVVESRDQISTAKARCFAERIKDQSMSKANDVSQGDILASELSKTQNILEKTNSSEKSTQALNEDPVDPKYAWKTVVGRSNRKRPEPEKGRKENVTQLLVASPRKKAWIFLSGFQAKTSHEDILNYLKENGINNCNCYKMHTKKDKIRSSFKLSVPIEKKKEAMSPELWPAGIVINHFLNLQRRLPQTAGVMGSAPINK